MAAQTFHDTPTPKTGQHAWRKITFWKRHLVHPTSRAALDVLLQGEQAIRSRRSEALAGLRAQLAAAGAQPLFDSLLEHEFVRLELGYFDLHYPVWHLQDNAKVKEFQRCAVALIDLQLEYLSWVGLVPAARASEKGAEPQVVRAATELRARYEEWRPRKLNPSSMDRVSQFEELNQLPQSAQFAGYMRRRLWRDEQTAAGPLKDSADERPEGLHVIMAAEWQDFIGLACALSIVDEVEETKEDGQRLADYVWNDSLPTWTYFTWPETRAETTRHYQVMASQYATTDQGDVWALDGPGSPMDDVTVKKNGLEQHLVQHIGERFLHMNFDGRLHLSVQNGMATDLVFEIYDENQEKSSGYGVSNQTQAYEVFIPGAPSAGGILPAISADNRVRRGWKAKKGEGGDRFHYFLSHELAPGLKVAREQLGRNAPDAHPYYFPIFPRDDNLDKRVVYPPLFGTPEVSLPGFFPRTGYASYAPDHRAFFRAYKVYFAYWLRTQGMLVTNGKAKDARAVSEAAFARLLRSAAQRCDAAGPIYAGDTIGETPFLEAIEEIYGMPLTGVELTDPDRPNLEGRCLMTLE